MFKILEKKIKNNSILVNNIFGSFFVKGLSLLIGLFTMPVYIRYFDDATILGVWFTILSFLTWILTFDLGIGNGLRNKLVIALTNNEEEEAKRYISSAYFIVGAIAIITIFLGYIIIGILDWNTILNISDIILENKFLVKVIRIVFIGIIIQFFLKLIISILYAMQKMAISNFLILLSNSLILMYALFFKSESVCENLLNLSIVNVFTVNLPLLFVTIIIFSTRLKAAKPNLKYYVKSYAKDIFKLGGTFFIIQIMFMIITSTNEILITRLYNPDAVVEYQVYFKIFYLFITLFSLITNPIWSAITKSYAENNIKWIKKISCYLNIGSIFFAVFSFSLIPIFQIIVDLWLGVNYINARNSFLIVFSLYSIVMVLNFSSTCIANGVGKLKTQLVFYTFAAIVKIPLCIVLSFFIDEWISVMIANVLVLLPCMIAQFNANINLFKSIDLKEK